MYGELPTREQLAAFKSNLTSNRALPGQILDEMRGYPTDASPMVSLRTAVSALAFYDPQAQDMSSEANEQKGIRLIAQFPALVAAIQRIRSGQEPVAPDPDLDEATNFLYMLDGKRPSETLLTSWTCV